MSTDTPKGLGEARWPSGYDRIILDETDSTNAEAARMAGGLRKPTWIMARHQTAARGRRGKTWDNPKGNLAATLMMRPGGLPGWAALRSFLAANALYETMALYTKRDNLALKWPNDVLLNGGKVAGILLETTSSGGTVDWLAVGIGVNLAKRPTAVKDAAFAPVSLAEEVDGPIDAEEFLTVLAGFYATEESILETMGFEPIRQSWLSRAARLGEIITAKTGDKEISGTFDSIDDQGQLVLISAKGPVKIPAADVFF